MGLKQYNLLYGNVLTNALIEEGVEIDNVHYGPLFRECPFKQTNKQTNKYRTCFKKFKHTLWALKQRTREFEEKENYRSDFGKGNEGKNSEKMWEIVEFRKKISKWTGLKFLWDF